MGKFEAGGNPADHTVAEVTEFLKGDDVTGDEYDRVLAAERDREGGGRVGILNLSGVETPVEAPAEPVGEPAGPNEAATGQESPADQAKTVDDPQASGDAGTTAEPYPDDAPPQLGPEQPQSKAEEDAHAATLAAAEAAQAQDLSRREEGAADRPATQTPEQALALAVKRSTALNRSHVDNQ